LILFTLFFSFILGKDDEDYTCESDGFW